MHTLDQKGHLLAPLIIVSTLFLAALGFGVWAFMGRQDYKNNVDEKIAEAVTVAEEQLTIKKDAEYAEAAKQPFITYTGPAAYGSLAVTHPRTWSIYVDEKGGNSEPLKGYMSPNYVSADNQTISYALRFEVVNQAYDAVLKQFDGAVRQAKVTTAAYRLPKVESVVGLRLEGEVEIKKTGVMIILPLRDKTIKIWTEGDQFRADFEEILKQLTFVP